MAASPQETCRLCAHVYALDAGRMHGQCFKCWQCLNAEQTIRRNLGDTQDLQGWNQEECQSFYQRLQQQKEQSGGKLLWKTVRATMLNTLCERALARFESTCEVTPLPLSVWLARGWDKETVEGQPNEYSTEYGCQVYKVPIRSLRWSEVFEREESKLLNREKEATQKRTGKQSTDASAGVDVPLQENKGNGSAKTAAQEAKAEAAALRKSLATNGKVAALAVRTFGPLSSAETSVTKAMVKVEAHKENVPEGVVTCGQDTQGKLRAWIAAARAAIDQAERNKGLDTPVPLAALPYTAEDMKIQLKVVQEFHKAVRSSLPKRAPKAKKDAATTNAAPPKRRRTSKSAA